MIIIKRDCERRFCTILDHAKVQRTVLVRNPVPG